MRAVCGVYTMVQLAEQQKVSWMQQNELQRQIRDWLETAPDPIE